jgi:hypothetical protein
MPILEVTLYSLERFAQPQRVVPPPREGFAVVLARHPTVASDRFLFDGVGRSHCPPWRHRHDPPGDTVGASDAGRALLPRPP